MADKVIINLAKMTAAKKSPMRRQRRWMRRFENEMFFPVDKGAFFLRMRSIDVAVVDTVPLGVDTPEDLETARRILEGK